MIIRSVYRKSKNHILSSSSSAWPSTSLPLVNSRDASSTAPLRSLEHFTGTSCWTRFVISVCRINFEGIVVKCISPISTFLSGDWFASWKTWSSNFSTSLSPCFEALGKPKPFLKQTKYPPHQGPSSWGFQGVCFSLGSAAFCLANPHNDDSPQAMEACRN